MAQLFINNEPKGTFTDPKQLRKWCRNHGLTVKDATRVGDRYYFTTGQAQPKVINVPTVPPAEPPKFIPTTPKPAEGQPEINDRDRQWLKRFTEHLYQAYGIDHYPTVFRNLKKAYHHQPNGKHQLVYGYELMEYFFNNGFKDYRSIHHLLWSAYPNLTGRRGLWATVIHEFAHVLQTETPNGRTYGSVHNNVFIDKARELQTLFPYNEVAQL